ncbi:SDR family oxidoreductase [Streptomyces sp. NPDC048172]|uniref:SDR family oxidoreductase n=1 Tax=Streptomyces sp. NPDC048172 TaxID=3365505 RepID=UPI0037240EF0
MILVTGATGTVGAPLVRALRDRGATVRALVRNGGGAPAAWDDGVTAVVADLDDPGSLTAAVEGVDAVYLLTPVGPDAARQERDVIDAAARAGRPKVVLQAAIGLGHLSSPVRFFDAHAEGFAHLRASGLPWTAVAPNGFFQNFLGMAPAFRNGTLPLPVGNAAVSYVDARDVAEVAARVLTTDEHDGAVHEITGPEALRYDEVARRIGDVLGRDVTYHALTPEQIRAALLDTGMAPWQADGIVELYGMYEAGEASAVTGTVTELLGRAPRSLDTFLADHSTALRASPDAAPDAAPPPR